MKGSLKFRLSWFCKFIFAVTLSFIATYTELYFLFLKNTIWVDNLMFYFYYFINLFTIFFLILRISLWDMQSSRTSWIHSHHNFVWSLGWWQLTWNCYKGFDWEYCFFHTILHELLDKKWAVSHMLNGQEPLSCISNTGTKLDMM